MYKHIIKASLYCIKKHNYIFADTHKEIKNILFTNKKNLKFEIFERLMSRLIIQYEEETKEFYGIYIVHIYHDIIDFQNRDHNAESNDNSIQTYNSHNHEIRKSSIIAKPQKTEYVNSDGTIDKNKFCIMELTFNSNDD